MRISEIKAREILDSRGNPTVEAEVVLENGLKTCASVPSGASVGKYEAIELRDGDKSEYSGKGVKKAVNNINTKISKLLAGKKIANIFDIDSTMIKYDGTENKSNLGANAILAVSLACARAASESLHIELFEYIGGINANTLPYPMMNILNGGVHSENNLDIQEFMIVPVGAKNLTNAIRACTEVFHTFKDMMKTEGKSISVGDEGGIAPDFNSAEEAIESILEAVKHAGYKAGCDFKIALDAAASGWKSPKNKGCYYLPKYNGEYETDELIAYWDYLCGRYPIFSLEDPIDEDDIEGWQMITKKLGQKVLLVGDDLFATNAKRLKDGIKSGCANTILIKPNQVGTLSETLNVIKLAQSANYQIIISHRSGETEDTFIADLSVGVNSGLIKAGAPSRGERTAKYNRLLKIEEKNGFSFKSIN